jgi:Flp pilus assembly protein TadD
VSWMITHRFLLVLLAVAAFVFLGSLTGLRDWDTFYHLAYGRDILRRGGFALEDPFLYPLVGIPSGAQSSWLGSLAIYLSWLTMGDAGPVYFAGLLGAALAVILLVECLEADRTLGGFLLAVIPMSFWLVVLRPRAVARPELFGAVFLALTLLSVRRHVAGSPWLLAGFPLVALAWANLHPSVLAGIAVIALYVLINALLLSLGPYGQSFAEIQGARQLLLPLGALAGAFTFVGLLVPTREGALFGPLDFALYVFGLHADAFGQQQSHALVSNLLWITELAPLPLSDWLGPLGWLVAIVLATVAITPRRVSGREVVTAAVFCALAGGALRFAPMAATVLTPLAARGLRSAYHRFADRNQRRGMVAITMLAAGALFASAWIASRTPDVPFGTRLGPRVPVRATEYLKAIGFSGRLFNTFHLGGWLEWSLDMKVFQDGRGKMRAEDARPAMLGPPSYATFATLDRRYRFDALVIDYPEFADDRSFAAAEPDRDWAADRSVWALVAFDDGSQVYLRRDGRYSDIARRDEFRFIRPSNAFYMPMHAPVAGLLSDLERSVHEAPSCVRCRVHLGTVYLRVGRPALARDLFVQALDGPSETRLYSMTNLALAYGALGDRVSAEAWLRAAIRYAPSQPWPRRELARLLGVWGRPRDALKVLRPNLESVDVTWEDVMLGRAVAPMAGDSHALERIGHVQKMLESRQRAEALHQQGLEWVRAGRAIEAMATFRAEIAEFEASAEGHVALARLLQATRQGEAALSEYRRALEIEPNFADARALLGMLLEARGEVAAAVREYRKYLALPSDGAWADRIQDRLARLGK